MPGAYLAVLSIPHAFPSVLHSPGPLVATRVRGPQLRQVHKSCAFKGRGVGNQHLCSWLNSGFKHCYRVSHTCHTPSPQTAPCLVRDSAGACLFKGRPVCPADGQRFKHWCRTHSPTLSPPLLAPNRSRVSDTITDRPPPPLTENFPPRHPYIHTHQANVCCWHLLLNPLSPTPPPLIVPTPGPHSTTPEYEPCPRVCRFRLWPLGYRCGVALEYFPHPLLSLWCTLSNVQCLGIPSSR